ncbi:MAG TPA: hypothetical protein VE733_28240 [Streptosporangiaceae bacterium]|jgi:hypothetical protein|nr:hypothetical protein [Streptosporangiaceae bacterium]
MLLTCNLPRHRGKTGPIPRQALLHWLTSLVAVSAMVLLPWIAYLAVTLPQAISARHWPLVWSGLDGAMAAGLAATALLAIRRDHRIAFVAVSTATLLLTDAWFDVCTSPQGKPLAWAIVDMGVEVAEAAACLVLARAVWQGRQDRRCQHGGSDGSGHMPGGNR